MATRFDWIVVGSGFAGSTFARILAENGLRIMVLEQRDHIGGNSYDEINELGIRIHKYGPHLFHTNSNLVWNFLNKFSDWTPYQHKVLAVLENGVKVPLPINFNSLKIMFRNHYNEIISNIKKEFYNYTEVSILKMLNSESNLIKDISDEIFQKIYKGYSQKQWGVPTNEISISTLSRVPVRFNYNDNHFIDTFQALPKYGYSDLFQNILNHKNIELKLNTKFSLDFFDINQKILYTGSLDDLLNYKFGVLPYRSLIFKHQNLDIKDFQIVAQENYSSFEEFTRIIEYSKIHPTYINKTTIVREYPQSFTPGKNIPFYPIKNEANIHIHDKYLSELNSEFPNLYFLGRLADYKYYNMDQVIARSLMFAKNIISG